MASDTPAVSLTTLSSQLLDLAAGSAGSAAATTMPTLAAASFSPELAAALLGQGNGSSELVFSEEDELKLLNFPSKREDLSTAVPLTVIFALLLVTGCVGNLCTAFVIARPKNKYMHTATNYYLFSLAMSDFLFLTLGLPQEMYGLWQRYPYVFGESFCIIRGYLSEASTYASILTISAFTIERYVAICHPLWAHTMSQLPRAITSIVIIWILAAICAIPPAAGLGIITQRGPLSNKTLEQSAQCATKRIIYENMFVVSAIVFFIVPMIIVTVLYILIALELRRSSKMNSAITKQSSSAHIQQATDCTTTSSSHTCCCQHPSRMTHHTRARAPANGHHLRRANQHLSAYSAMSQAHSQQLLATGNFQPLNGCEPPTVDGSCSPLPTGHVIDERPASALGTERGGGARLGASLLGASLAKLHPFGLSMRALLPRQQQQVCSCSCCCCCCGDRKALVLQHSQSNQLDPASAVIGGGNGGGSFESIVHKHSPLSYHESLMQHNSKSRQPAVEGEKLGSAGAEQTTDHDRKPPVHQLSSPAAYGSQHQSSSMRNLSTTTTINRPSCQRQQQLKLHHLPSQHHHNNNSHSNNQHHHHHRHNNHHQHHSQLQQQQQATRRATGASSKKSVIRMLVAVVVSFFICWVPFHAQRLLASYLAKDENQNQLLLDIYLKLTYISGVMYYLSSTINPLLYQLMSAKFRLAFKETFKCSLFKCLQRRASCSPSNSLKEANQQQSRSHYPHLAGANHNHHLTHQHHHQHHAQQLACEVSSAGATPPAECSCQCGRFAALPAPPVGQLGRLRGRLNASLASLLRLNNNTAGNCSFQCGYATAGYNPLANNQVRQPPAPANGSMSASQTIDIRTELASNDSDLHYDRGQSTAAESTFTPRTMLKFMKSPTPVVVDCQKNGLSRICSREEDEEAAADLSRNNNNNNNNNLVVAHKADGDSATARKQTATDDSDKLEALMKLTKATDDELHSIASDLHQASSLNGTNTASDDSRSPSSGQSSGSSPDQQPQQTPHKLALTGSSSSNESARGRRRRSLQQQHLHHQLRGQPTQCHPAAPSDGDADRRRKTSSSSAKRQISSSLSSSERQLDKKHSLSTTTSAIYDCGSYTTTHSQLTGCGSNSSNPAFALRRSSEEDEIEEDEPTSVVNAERESICRRHEQDEADTGETDSLLPSGELKSIGDKGPLLAARELAATRPSR